MAYFDIKIQETAKASQKILEYVHQLGSKIEKIQDIIHKLQGSDDSFEAIIEYLRNKEEEMSKQRDQMYALKLVLDQVITQYQQTEESLIVTEETNLEKFNKVMTGITYRGMALGEGAIDVAAEAVEGAWKLLLEPPMRMGKQFIDWNANCLGIMSDEEYNKNTEAFNTYADEWNSSVINGVVNVFNFKDLEQNTVLSPFAKCWNNFGSYMSEDATYEDMVAYSKDIWNAAITIGAIKGAGSAVKGKIRGLKTGTGTLAEVVEESAIKSGKYSETEIKSIIDNLQGDGFKNNPLRQAYESEVAGLKAYGDELLASGMSEEQVARTLNQARRDLGIKYKNATPQPLRDYIYEVNMGRYGDKLGPTYDYMIKVKRKSNMEIINSSSRPNVNIDKLLSGFEEWLRRQ